MSERPTSNWSAGSWVLALCLAWLWMRPASASLQPPTSAGLGKVVRRGKGARRHSSPSHKAGRSLGLQSLPQKLSSFLTESREGLGRPIGTISSRGKVFGSEALGWRLKSSLLA